MSGEVSYDSTTSEDGTPIGYMKRGSGPALVIAHGSIATSDQWIPATEHLAEHFTCFVHDRRGRARSGDSATYSLQSEIADISAIMGVAGPGAHLLGHSYGALCALGYAEEVGLSGGTLGVYEPPLAVDGPVAGQGLPKYREYVANGDLEGALEHALINFVRLPAEAIPFVRETPLWGACVPLTPTWVRELEQIDALGADLSHYSSISAPTRVIAGTATSPFLFTSAQQLSRVIEGATLTELSGMDHFAHVVDPSGFAATVRELIL
jgi:pimeloyl-ACP methyl ester carboxylesterase